MAHNRMIRGSVVLTLLVLLVAAALAASLCMGSVRVTPMEALQSLMGSDGPQSMIVVEFRLPRAVAAMLVGAALAVAGALLQATIRNPLAAPDLIGITGGASVAAVAFMSLTAGRASIHWVPPAAMAGACLTAGLIYVLAWKRGVNPLRLVLIGIGISTAMGALTTFLLISGPAYLASQVLNWMTGSVYGIGWKQVTGLLPWTAVFLLLPMLRIRQLNVMSLGDMLVTGLGVRLEWNRLLLIAYSVALAGSAVGVAGTIGFVGLMAPHMARKLTGHSHVFVLPASALIGALLVLLADLAGRMLFQPMDIPAGVFTAAFGAPFFLVLLYRSRK